MEYQNFGIKQIKEFTGIDANIDNGLIVFSEMVGKFDMFKYPCKLDAVIFGLCLSGSTTITINLKEYEITAGTLIVNLPNNIVQLGKEENFKCIGLFASMDFMKDMPNLLKETAQAFSILLNNPCMLIPKHDVIFIAKSIREIEELNSNYSGVRKTLLLRTMVFSLLVKMMDIYDRIKTDSDNSPKTRSTIRKEAFFEQFMMLVAENHTAERGVNFYAEKMHITPKYLSTLIKSISGKSATEWIDRYVILEAKNMLKFSNLSIQEIAYHLNFSTQSFFGKYFKQHTGLSPKDYRNKGIE